MKNPYVSILIVVRWFNQYFPNSTFHLTCHSSCKKDLLYWNANELRMKGKGADETTLWNFRFNFKNYFISLHTGKVTHSKILLWHILFAVTFTNTSKVCGLTDSFLYTPHILITQWFISANLTVKRWHVLSSLTQHWAHMLKVRVTFEGY